MPMFVQKTETQNLHNSGKGHKTSFGIQQLFKMLCENMFLKVATSFLLGLFLDTIHVSGSPDPAENTEK